MSSGTSLFAIAPALLVSGAAFISSACATLHPAEPKPLGVSSIEPDVGSAPHPIHQDPPLVRRIRSLQEALSSCAVETAGPTCEAWMAWQELDWTEIESARPTLYELLAALNDSVRFAAVYALALDESSITDAGQADQLVTALEAERNSTVLVRLVRLVGQIDFTQNPKAASRVLELMEHPPTPATRANLFSIAEDVPGVAKTLVRMFDLGTPAERSHILQLSPRILSTEVCPIVEHALEDERLAETAFGQLAMGDCPALWDKGIAWLPTAKIPLLEYTFASKISYFCAQEVTDVQRTRLLTQAKRFAKTKEAPGVRIQALHSVLKCDPTAGRSFVRGFSSDPDQEVASAARDLSKPPQPE
ncbi:MAG: hypothetical protein R3B07_02200 [Polyangiaceae bacterium]